MKRILLPAGGAVLATGLLAAGLAGTAHADNTVSATQMVGQDKIASVIDFWEAANGAAMRQATAYTFDYKKVGKIVQKGGYTPDTKPSSVPAIGDEPKKAIKYQNINVPKTIGRVFFAIGKDLYWCSATSVQSQYRNLVATAGHCVYDIKGNNDVLDNWVFVPGYYQGKAPWGVYVGKTAYTHYDFTNYEDFDRDYAFVTVYNGVKGGTRAVSKDEYDKFTGKKFVDVQWEKVDQKTYEDYVAHTGNPGKVVDGVATQITGPEDNRGVYSPKEVDKADYDAAAAKGGPTVIKRGAQAFTTTDIVSKEEAAAYKAKGGLGDVFKEPSTGQWKITHYYVKQWIIPGKDAEFYIGKPVYVIYDAANGDRLGDAVGGQGVAWNQPTGKYVRIFGYPGGEHPDGNKPFTGVTPKWCYNKTSGKATVISAYKVEEQVALKCTVTGGFDGSSWLYKYSNAKRTGYVNGVTSLIVDTDGNNRFDTITSPYFDGETASVYKAAAAQWSGNVG